MDIVTERFNAVSLSPCGVASEDAKLCFKLKRNVDKSSSIHYLCRPVNKKADNHEKVS